MAHWLAYCLPFLPGCSPFTVKCISPSLHSPGTPPVSSGCLGSDLLWVASEAFLIRWCCPLPLTSVLLHTPAGLQPSHPCAPSALVHSPFVVRPHSSPVHPRLSSESLPLPRPPVLPNSEPHFLQIGGALETLEPSFSPGALGGDVTCL